MLINVDKFEEGNRNKSGSGGSGRQVLKTRILRERLFIPRRIWIYDIRYQSRIRLQLADFKKPNS
jgi:hypothetical protein